MPRVSPGPRLVLRVFLSYAEKGLLWQVKGHNAKLGWSVLPTLANLGIILVLGGFSRFGALVAMNTL